MNRKKFSSVFLFLVFCLLASDGVVGESRERRTVSGSRQGPNRSQLSDVLRNFVEDGGDLSQYTPPTPRPQDVNCHVEIPSTIMIGGRCINLGSDASANMVCQAGAHLAFSSDCLGADLPATRRRRANGNTAAGRALFQTLTRERNAGD